MPVALVALVFVCSPLRLPSGGKARADEPDLRAAREAAVRWALQRQGRAVQPCSTPGCIYNEEDPGLEPCTNPTNKPDAEDIKKGLQRDGHALWFYYCVRFVRTAYAAPPRHGSAKALAEAVSDSLKTGEEIPPGALVLWRWSTVGHVGVHVGKGKIAHTGVLLSTKDVGIRLNTVDEVSGMLGKDSYLGWVDPTAPPLSWGGKPGGAAAGPAKEVPEPSSVPDLARASVERLIRTHFPQNFTLEIELGEEDDDLFRVETVVEVQRRVKGDNLGNICQLSYSVLNDLGYIRIEKIKTGRYAWHNRITVTDKGKTIGSVSRRRMRGVRLGPFKSVYEFKLADVVFAGVTGVKEESPSAATVKFTWRKTGFNEVYDGILERDDRLHEGWAKFGKYDDGWRIEEINPSK